MGDNLSVTDFQDALQDYYTPDRMMRMVYEDRPTLALLPKDEKWIGDKHIIPIQYVAPQGRSQDFATAQANSKPGGYDRFELTTSHDYGIIHIDHETMLASEGQPARYFVQARTSEIDGILTSLAQSLSKAVFGNGGGSRGQRSGALASGNTVLQLEEIEDVVNFETGQIIEASENDGSDSAHTLRGGTTVEITGVDRDLGQLTAADWTAITSFTAGDYLFVDGDFKSMLKGFGAWVPATAPSSTLFFGVNRTTDVTRLAGVRYSDSNPLPEKLKRAAARLGREGARPTHCAMNPMDWVDLEVALSDSIQYDVVKSPDGIFGFEAIKLRTPRGTVLCYADPDCKRGVAWMLTMSTWKLVSRGGAPRVLDPDNVGKVLRQSDKDGVEGRFGFYAQLGNKAPGYNARVTL